MCGIIGGFWTPVSQLNKKEKFELGLAQLLRRGPDHQAYQVFNLNAGEFYLGHTRLSIIDLSTSAQQPMKSIDGRFIISFNGEIYNYIEIKDELKKLGYYFQTNSDTEVLLAAWSQWGSSCLSKLKGMFAFAIFDTEKHTITIARDAFGIKPLYFSLSKNSFVFASEINAVRLLCENNPDVNWQRSYDYLVHSEYDYGCETFFNGIETLPPAHLLTIDLRNHIDLKKSCWWKPSIARTYTGNFAYAAEELRHKLISNVALHLRSDVSLGAALSGGIDSSVITSIIRHINPDIEINTFSFIADDKKVSEEPWIDLINGSLNASSHKIHISPNELINDIDDLIATQGEPFGSSSIYAQYRVFKLASEKGVVVTLDGQGADEMLGGYNGYVGQRFHSLVDDGEYLSAFKFLSAWASWPSRSLPEGLKRVVAEYASPQISDFLRGINGMPRCPDWIKADLLREAGVVMSYPQVSNTFSQPGRRMAGKLASSLYEKGLLGLLRHGDRNSMRFSVESRVPFLTTDLADFTLSLPEEYLVSKTGTTKYLLRESMRGIVPNAILDRKDKIGFATPEKNWLLEITEKVTEWLSINTRSPFIDHDKLMRAYKETVSGKRAFSWQIWRWINFNLWLRSL
jgi:asparagine synthase (glutamine-hydrolysing)